MPARPACCPECRARLGFRTTFALGDLWDPRVRSPEAVRLHFQCHACGHPLRYPVNTFGSFAALAVMPIVSMALLRDFGLPELQAYVPGVLPLYWSTLGAVYSLFAAPASATPVRRG